VRADFPILRQRVHDKPLVYLDNAATAQKPRAVLDALDRHYTEDNANVHRGVHLLSERATRAYEDARVKVQHFLNAADSREVIFVRGATEGINLVAQSYGRQHLRAGDEIVISAMEHHSNIVPWQMLCEQTGAVLRVVPINDAGEFLLEEYGKLLGPRTRLVAVVQVSNSLGTVNPVRQIIKLAHERNVPVLLDGAQAVPHLPIDVQELDCDFYAFSGHKLYGPTGIGVLYGKAALLDAMPPWQGGGDMIRSVTFAKTLYADLPNKFEAGTPHIAGAIGLGAAIDYVQSVGLAGAAHHEARLLRYATEGMGDIPGVRILGTARDKAAVISFVVDDPPISPLDLGTQLDLEGVAVRTGHHCCQPVMDRFGIAGTARASLAMYNTTEDIDRFLSALRQIVREAGVTARAAAWNRNVAAPADLKFPEPAAPSPQAAADQLAEVFEMLDDRETRTQYVLELGEKLLPLPEALKTEANRVHGCMSIVHIVARRRPGTADRLDFLASSDAHIVRGLIGILQQLYAGQRAADVLDFDVEGFFQRIGLDQFISSQRRNGLAGMVKRIRAEADRLASGEVKEAS
jgi:cysteine desulfurase/selenocysteine lyase